MTSLRGSLLGWALLSVARLVACGSAAPPGADGSAGGSVGTGGSAGAGGAIATGGSAQTGGMGGLPPVFEAPTSVAELCEVYPEAWAAFMARCVGGDPEELEERVDTPCAPAATAESEGHITLAVDQVEECFAALSSPDCNALEGAPCTGLTVGTVPAGQACKNLGFQTECAPGSHCELADSCVGTCEANGPYGVEGEICHGMFVDVVCEPGLVCDGPTAQCMVAPGEGEACTGVQGACQPGLYCADAGENAFVCRPPETSGPCVSESACELGFACVQDESGTGSCQTAKRPGEACTVGRQECAGFCSLAGVCELAADEGERCGFLQSDPYPASESATCGAGLFCHLEVDDPPEAFCRSQVALGETCPNSLSGSACQEGDTVIYCSGGSERECVSCD
jgi:hypothetical protein